MRVVSLLPSATEIVAAIGGLDRLVGRSHECDFPAAVASVPALTAQRTIATTSAAIDRDVRDTLETPSDSLYTLDTERLRDLAPDVILVQNTCRVCSIDLDTVRGAAAALDPVPEIVCLDPHSIEGVFDDVLRVGEAIGLPGAAHDTMVALRDRYWTAIDYVNPYVDGPRVVVLEWMAPLYVAGHWTPALIEKAGGRDPFALAGQPSRRIAPEELLEVMPDRIVVAPCGMTLDAIEREKNVLTETRWWPLLPAVMSGDVAFLDGTSTFSRPGPRLVETFRWLVGWINGCPEMRLLG